MYGYAHVYHSRDHAYDDACFSMCAADLDYISTCRPRYCPKLRSCTAVTICLITVQTISLILTFLIIQGRSEVVILGQSEQRFVQHFELLPTGDSNSTGGKERRKNVVPLEDRHVIDSVLMGKGAAEGEPMSKALLIEKQAGIGLPRRGIANVSADSFLEIYEEYCNRTYVFSDVKKPLCPCVPPGLVGEIRVPKTTKTIAEITHAHPELHPGGNWKPRDCTSRHRVAIIVPYRDRETHKLMFLEHIHPILQRQMLDYQIIIVEQNNNSVFNKASMMNVGFLEAQNEGVFDCYVFHDVDMLPEDDRNMYTCHRTPRHVGVYVDKFNYTLLYRNMFGGVTAFTAKQFRRVNGFSNQYYGWGGEDDDMSKRLLARRFRRERYPPSVARYTMVKHEHDKRNPFNLKSRMGFRFRPKSYSKEGLRTLQYKVLKSGKTRLYTWILAEIPPPSEDNMNQDWEDRRREEIRNATLLARQTPATDVAYKLL